MIIDSAIFHKSLVEPFIWDRNDPFRETLVIDSKIVKKLELECAMIETLEIESPVIVDLTIETAITPEITVESPVIIELKIISQVITELIIESEIEQWPRQR
jgi:hypothetical protein